MLRCEMRDAQSVKGSRKVILDLFDRFRVLRGELAVPLEES